MNLRIALDSEAGFLSQNLPEQDPTRTRSRTDARCQSVCPALLDQVDRLTRQVDTLTDQVQKLTPRNSSLPPRTEHLHSKPKRKPTPGMKRKQGGQKGHKRNSRELIPVERCTTVEQCSTVTSCHPNDCRRCGATCSLTGLIRSGTWSGTCRQSNASSMNTNCSVAIASAAAAPLRPAFLLASPRHSAGLNWRPSPVC